MLLDPQITRVPVPAWAEDYARGPGEEFLVGQQEWHFATPSVFQVLASPQAYKPIPTAPEARGQDSEHLRGYWTSALYLLMYRLGWADPAGGLDWWESAGHPEDDATLRLFKAIWQRDGLLPILRAWLQGQPRPFRSDFERRCQYAPMVRIATGDSAADRLAFDPRGPDQLHLKEYHGNHLTRAFDGGLESGMVLRTAAERRQAVFTTQSMVGWYGSLIEHGKALRDQGNRSWHVDVHGEPVGDLGRYRRSVPGHADVVHGPTQRPHRWCVRNGHPPLLRRSDLTSSCEPGHCSLRWTG